MDVLIRNLPDQTVRLAKRMALKHKRSLQKELSSILVDAIRFQSGSWSREADTIRRRLGKKVGSDSVDLVREDRNR